MGVDGKDAWVRDMRRDNEVEFLVMQETKTQGLDRQCLERFWGIGSFDFEVVDPTGLSGGLVSLWDSSDFVKERVVKNRNFIVVGGRLRKDNIKINVVNVYGPQSRSQKLLVWQALKSLMCGSEEFWILMGDYNTVRSSEERLNTGFNEAMARDFNEFIDEAGLVDLFNKWPSASLRALPRRFSDHCPLILHMVSKNFGPKPFRWFNSWVEKVGCKDVVREVLGKEMVAHSAQLKVYRKLKTLSYKLRDWHVDVAKKEKEDLGSCCSEVDALEKLMEDRSLSEEEEWILEDDNMWEALPVNKYATGSWKAIVKVVAGMKVNDVAIHTYIRAKVGNGVSVRFWIDVWLDECALRDKWPLLYRLEGNKTCTVAERTKVFSNKLVMDAEWIDKIRTTDELMQWVQLCEAMNMFAVSMGQDCWKWAAEGQPEFTAKGTADLLMQRYDYGSNFVMKWVSWVPLKCSIMAWRAEQNRIPTRTTLVQRNIVIQDLLCPWCRARDETEMHILADCLIAANVWDCIGSWCRTPPIFAFGIKDLLKARNETVFNGKEPSVERIVRVYCEIVVFPLG
ncbi:RNA-directed DNA polymerase, eukaryota [Artemisia annua]|uniref:RNA-directed DNA polymerase, eukaryota n=1 Tax=Artemisia annua TaxID=35608 RepID=A0A2U1PSC7_ARTAN|nr:RNA-directed DNA polymerase, eukaryota [Artemisia annua]